MVGAGPGKVSTAITLAQDDVPLPLAFPATMAASNTALQLVLCARSFIQPECMSTSSTVSLIPLVTTTHAESSCAWGGATKNTAKSAKIMHACMPCRTIGNQAELLAPSWVSPSPPPPLHSPWLLLRAAVTALVLCQRRHRPASPNLNRPRLHAKTVLRETKVEKILV